MESKNALPSEQKFKGRRSLDELIKKLEEDKSLVMNNDFRETLNHLNEIIAYKRMKIAQILAKPGTQAPSTSETQSLSPEEPSSGAPSTYSEAPTQAAEEHTIYNYEAVDQTLPPSVTTKRKMEMCDKEDSELEYSELEESSEEECQLLTWIMAGTPVRGYPDSRFCKKRTKKYTKRQRRVMPKNSL